jgi:putative ABC transport system permease protein
LKDLRYRWRQFLIAVVGASLVFALTLVMAGLAAAFSAEINLTVHAMGADAWVVTSGSSGRITALSTIPQSDAGALRQEPGVRAVSPLVASTQAVNLKGNLRSINLFGYQQGGLGQQQPTTGSQIHHRGEAIVDSALGVSVGQEMAISGKNFRVVGTVNGRTLTGGDPNVYVLLPDAQSVVFEGRPLVNALLTTGVPQMVPSGLADYSNAEIEQRTLDQMASAVSSLDSSRFLMWFIATLILAALVYITALERTRDFAVLKALGSSSGLLYLGLAFEAVVVALLAAVLAAVISRFMGGIFDQPVYIPGSAFVVLPISALLVGLLSSLIALRRAVSVDPALAFAAA